MARQRMKKLLTITTAALTAGAILSAVPASADCQSAEVSYQLLGGAKQYVVGPKKCVVSTPWNEGLTQTLPVGSPGLLVVEGRAWVSAP